MPRRRKGKKPMKLRRSALYVPASSPRALKKAPGLDADCIIIDLEDAVADEEKDTARRRAAEALAEGPWRAEVVIRVNAPGTPAFEADMAMAAASPADAILLPKVCGPADVLSAATALPPGKALWAMMETAAAMTRPAEIAATAARAPLAALVMGTNDLMLETGASPASARFALVPWLMACLAAARAHGLAILDGVCNDLSAGDAFEAECLQGRHMGMDGKTLIHPAQIAAANRIFAPTAEEIAEAEEIVAAFARPENAARGAIRLGGRMVERLHLRAARRTLEKARAARRREMPPPPSGNAPE